MLKYIRSFIAGFASVPSLAFGKITKFSLMESRFALQKDELEIASDIRSVNKKLKKNER